MKKNVIVTGAYGQIGKAISRQLAGSGYNVTMVGRDHNKLQSAREEISREVPGSDVDIAVVDLSLQKDIRRFAEDWVKPLHVLINNAGTTPVERRETEEGIEVQWATNVLGYFWLTKFLTCIMNSSAPARVINVASYYAGGLDLDDPEFKKRKYNNDAAYQQSKQADRMLTVAFAEKLAALGITVNSCHPGDVNSKLSNNLGYHGGMSPDQGAATPVWLATDPSVEKITGKFFAQKKEQWCEFSHDKNSIERLFRICEDTII